MKNFAGGPGRRLSILSLGLFVGVAAGHVSAQEPVYVPSAPKWSAQPATQSMSLLPVDAKLGVGLDTAAARLHVIGDQIEQKPGSGTVIVGSIDQLHMQIDRNELRVAGPTADTVGALHLQRFGGPVMLRASQEAVRRVIFPEEGGLVIGGEDPWELAKDIGLWYEPWTRSEIALAVDGHAFAPTFVGYEGNFVDRVRVGHRADAKPNAAWDDVNRDAVGMFAGLLTAQEIIVHIDRWADDVFAPGYQLMSLADTRAYIEQHHRLPGVPSEREVSQKGVNLGAMDEALLRKVEELTLHVIAQQERIEALEEEIDACE